MFQSTITPYQQNQPHLVGEEALNMLADDHEKFNSMFAEFNRLPHEDDDQKWYLVQQICLEIINHSHWKEDFFYPKLRQITDKDTLLDEAELELAEIKDLISQLELMDAKDGNYCAEVNKLAAMLHHHIKAENKIFTRMTHANSEPY